MLFDFGWVDLGDKVFYVVCDKEGGVSDYVGVYVYVVLFYEGYGGLEMLCYV